MPITTQEIEKIVEKVATRVIKKMLRRIDAYALLAQKGGSFDFLFQEPEIYSERDSEKKNLKKLYEKR